MKKRIYIDRIWLINEGACYDETDVFMKLFPRGSYVNLKSLRKAIKAGLNVGWLLASICGTDTLNKFRDERDALQAIRNKRLIDSDGKSPSLRQKLREQAYAGYREALARLVLKHWRHCENNH